ncbi:MAG: hypothetical protein DMF26_06235 [Verrucomicrobia bacterium]|nr:MAG: hypothetical protein DMF26_06235 [Verrucomicrobiota bacterium]
MFIPNSEISAGYSKWTAALVLFNERQRTILHPLLKALPKYSCLNTASALGQETWRTAPRDPFCCEVDNNIWERAKDGLMFAIVDL